ncbi:RusA family crossover junction endodeoxyribonuclease [Clostridium sp.]|jgi:Holliday junction resolvase RusA-like endonuclease|uniref:RusA family crossover junction endodeoxyribonuclease n=1 Tax=Clostridium sp. TaxID=1506 RepID=UPI003A3DB635
MKIEFTVPGQPVAKARPRVTKRGFTYTPKKTVNYENWVKECYYTQNKDKRLNGQIRAKIRAYFSIPKSTSKKKRNEIIAGDIRPTKKPDTDNIAKIILDSLNTIAYDDDKQVIFLQIEKFYSVIPRVEIELEGE